MAITLQTLALTSNLYLVDRDGRVCPGESDTPVRQLAEGSSEVINRFGEDRSKLRWDDLEDITHVNTIELSKSVTHVW